MRGRFLSGAFIILLGACAAPGVGAQTETPRFEVGAQFSSLTLNIANENTGGGAPGGGLFGGFGDFGSRTEAGFGGRFTFNLTDSVALEAAGNFFPKDSTFITLTSGGRTLQGQFGVKAGKRYEKFGIFGKARPGLVSFGNVLTVTGTTTLDFNGQTFVVPTFDLKRHTEFAFDLGGVAEFYPSRRLVTRFEAGDTIIRYGSRDAPNPVFIGPTPTPPLFRLPAQTTHNFQFTAGVGWRF